MTSSTQRTAGGTRTTIKLSASVSIFVLHGPLRAPSGWSASVHGVHVHFVRAAGRVLAIVGERDDDVRAALRDFATSVAAVDPPRPKLLT